MYYSRLKIMIKKYLFVSAIAFLTAFSVQAQDDLLEELNEETKNETQFEPPAFKAMKIGNLQSTKIAGKGDFYLIVSHRFGTIKDGFDTFFGLDNANTKIQLLYSFWEGVQMSLSRESLRKTYAAALKVGIAKQSNKFPINLVAYGTVNRDTELDEDQFPSLKSGDRMSYALQLLASKRFSNIFSFELAPSYVRQNLQNLNLTGASNHNQFLIGLGGRYKLSKRMSINMDYAYNFNRDSKSVYNNPLTIGVDIETGGHVFQLLFSNAQSTNEPGFLSNAEGDWSDGNIFFGFNVVRVF
jgi:hypothetical protein